jgi:hypothetical protein
LVEMPGAEKHEREGGAEGRPYSRREPPVPH